MLSNDGTYAVLRSFPTQSLKMKTTWKHQVFGLEPYEEVGWLGTIELLALVRTDDTFLAENELGLLIALAHTRLVSAPVAVRFCVCRG